MTRGLIVVRCGRNSLHWDWLSSSERNWDIALCPYEPIDARGLEATVIPGLKWDPLSAFFRTFTRWRDYDFICLPDDDLATDAATLTAFFEFCAEQRVDLAAPALAPASYFSHLATMQNASFSARRTAFVEIMVPCFSAAFFGEVLRTLPLTPSGIGWGLDFLWPALLGYEGIWISDATAVRHTRPVGSLRNRRLEHRAEADASFFLGLGVPFLPMTIGGIDHHGVYRAAGEPGFIDLYQAGYGYLGIDGQQIAGSVLRQPPLAALPELRRRLGFALRHLAQEDRTISRGRPSRVSSVSELSWSSEPDLDAIGGNDGRLNGHYGFRTAFETGPWWQVDFGARHAVREVVIYNCLDQPQRFAEFDILVSDNELDWTTVLSRRDGMPVGGIDGNPFRHVFGPRPCCRFMRVRAMGDTCLHLDQIEVFGAAATEALAPGDKAPCVAVAAFPDSPDASTDACIACCRPEGPAQRQQENMAIAERGHAESRAGLPQQLAEQRARLAKAERSHGEFRAELEQQLVEVRQQFVRAANGTQRRLADIEGDLAQAKTTLSETQDRLSETQHRLSRTQAKLSDAEQLLGETQHRLAEVEASRAMRIARWYYRLYSSPAMGGPLRVLRQGTRALLRVAGR